MIMISVKYVVSAKLVEIARIMDVKKKKGR